MRLGINTTDGETLETINCTPASGVVNYTLDTSINGHSYFEVGWTSGILTLANRLDVEYGKISWEVEVIATDDDGPATATVTLTTFQSTTTTTSTQPPPGYDWFENSSNKYLFWAVMGFMALMFGTCVMLCIRFHRKGTCLPKSCPEFGRMIDSFNRQVTCCPLPCDFYNKDKPLKSEEETETAEHVDDTPWGLPLREAKPVTPKKSDTPKKPDTPKKEDSSVTEETERPVVVSPLVIGNVNLHDVGFDGMRSPGFNAPMFTSYGGKGASSKVFKKY